MVRNQHQSHRCRSLYRTNANITGAITASSGSITGAFTVGAALAIGASGVLYSGAASTWQSDGYQLEYNAGDPRLYIGDGGVTASDRYLMWDGTNLSWRAANTFLDTAGNLTGCQRHPLRRHYRHLRVDHRRLHRRRGLSIGTNGKLYSGAAATWQSDGYQLEYNAGDPRLYIGDGGVTTGDKYLMWDGANLSWRAANTYLDTPGNLTATSATLSGAITATSGSITGAFTVGAALAIGTNGVLYSGAAATWQSDGYQLEYNAGNPRFYIGDGGVTASDRYLMWDGTNLSWRAANTYLDTAGNLTAASATLAGAITATSGSITGAFTVGATLTVGTAGLIVSGATTYAAGTGYVLDYNAGTPRLRIGTTAGNRLTWDGAKLEWYAANTSLDASGNLTAASATLSGAITATSGSITGNFSIGTSGKLYSGAAATWQSDGYQLEYNAGDPRLYIGDGGVTASDKYLMWDGANLSWRAANTYLDTAGNLTAASATLAGAITATSGSITGAFTVGSTLTVNTAGMIVAGATSYAAGTGIFLGYDGSAHKFRIGATTGNRLTWDGTNLAWYGVNTALTAAGLFTATNADITGTITADAGSIGNWIINSTNLTSAISTPRITLTPGAANTARIEVGDTTSANLAGLNSPNAATDIAIWAGATHANRATAPFRVTANGNLYATGATLAGSGVPFTVNPTFGLKFRGARTDNKINVVDVNGAAPAIGNAMIGAEGKWGRAYQAAPATTNLVQNPSFEVDTAGYYEYNTANLLSAGANGTRDTKYAVYGGASLKYVTPNLAANEGWHCDLVDAVTASTSYTVSIYVYGSGALTFALINRSGGNVQFANTAITATKQWTRYSITATTPVGCTSVRIALYQPTQAAATFWADALQLEQKAYLTPFCDGSLGPGHTWAGTAHATSSSRTGIPTLSYANAYRFIPEATGTISCWFFPVAEKTGNTYMTLFRYSTSQHVIARIVNSGDVMQCYWGVTARNSSNAVTWNAWNHLALTVTDGNLNIYLNGVKTSCNHGHSAGARHGRVHAELQRRHRRLQRLDRRPLHPGLCAYRRRSRPVVCEQPAGQLPQPQQRLPAGQQHRQRRRGLGQLRWPVRPGRRRQRSLRPRLGREGLGDALHRRQRRSTCRRRPGAGRPRRLPSHVRRQRRQHAHRQGHRGKHHPLRHGAAA